MKIRCAIVCVVFVWGCCYAAAASNWPNFLVILADDVGRDAIGCYGGRSYPTPHVDALAAAGLRFEHGYVMPVCHPTRTTLLSGRYPFDKPSSLGHLSPSRRIDNVCRAAESGRLCHRNSGKMATRPAQERPAATIPYGLW